MTMTAIEAGLRKSWGWMAAFAVISLIGGVLALLNPLAATLTATLMAGWAFAFLGALQVFRRSDQGWGGFIWALLFGLLTLAVGLSLIFDPLAGMISLTILVAVLFLVTGIVKIMLSFSLRPLTGWGWVLLSGIVSLVLGIMILADILSAARRFLASSSSN